MNINEIKHCLFNKYYASLNENQREAVFNINGPLLVVAGAGSGKTTVLVNRIMHIVKFGNGYYSNSENAMTSDEKTMLESFCNGENEIPKEVLESVLTCFKKNPCDPDRILAITFTNKAANEMKERLIAVLGDDAKKVWASTFHSFCVKILKMFIKKTSLSENFTIYDQDDTKKLITLIMSEMKIDDNEITPKFVLNQISRAKNKFVNAKEFALQNSKNDKYRTVSEIFKKYEERLRSANAIDFDDIISKAVELIKKNSDVREWCNEKFKYVLVDEYQDTNKAQYELLKLISSKYQNIMVVGDDDQSIYKFRGAVVENILNFDKEFKNAKVIMLERNYRSTQTIVDAANDLISHNESRRGKTLWSGNDIGEKIKFNLCLDQDKEAEYVAETIIDNVSSGKYSYKDFAILYRGKAQSNAIESVFVKSGIPHRVLAGLRFYERAEIKDIVSYLRLIHNNSDEISLKRIINVPKRSIGEKTVDNCFQIAQNNGISVFDVLNRIDEFDEVGRASESLKKFASLISYLSDFSKSHSPSSIINEIIEKTDYFEYILKDKEKGNEKIENIQELISSAVKFEEKNDEATFDTFMEEIALVSDADGYEESQNSVVLMTMHAAKGLEFPVVFIPGMEETIFPSSMSLLSETEIEEERRLCYVALTRAKNELHLLACKKRVVYGKSVFNKISRFAIEIPEKYFDKAPVLTLSVVENQSHSSPQTAFKSYGSASDQYKPKSSVYRDEISHGSKENEKEKYNLITFLPGDKVRHKLFGVGTVISAKSFGGDILYEIDFESNGIKKLMATFAKLQKA